MAHVYDVYFQLSLKVPSTHPTLGLPHLFDVSIDFIVFIMKPRCSLLPSWFSATLVRTLVRGALYASTRPLLEERLTRARRQLLFRVHCSVVYLWPFLSCKMLENGSLSLMLWYTSASAYHMHILEQEGFAARGAGKEMRGSTERPSQHKRALKGRPEYVVGRPL